MNNKKGWSLISELFAILVAVILLIYAIFELNRMGLVRNINQAIPLVKPNLSIGGEIFNYDEVENSLIDASKKYVFDKYNNQFDGDTIVVRVSQLIKSGYISTIRDNKNKKCSGYVKVYHNDINLNYTPYLNCSSYVSDGYEKEYDW